MSQRHAIVAVLGRDGRFLWIRRGPAARFAGHWGPPSGRVEPGETQAEAVVREVREELGLEVEPRRKVWMCPTHDGSFLLHWWTASIRAGQLRPAADEVAAFRWLRPADLDELSPTFDDDVRYFQRVSLSRLCTARLSLERLRSTDLASLAALRSDPRVARMLGGSLSEPELHRQLAGQLAHWAHHGFGSWMLRERRSGRTIGQMGLRRLGAPEPDAVELHCALMPGYWGRGLATEAARRVIEVGLLELGLTSITAITLLDNAASRAVMRGAGMRRLGTRWHAGAPHVLYGISRAAAPASSPA